MKEINSPLFTYFPGTVVDNGWKNQMSGNFVFSLRKDKITQIWFFQPFYAT